MVQARAAGIDEQTIGKQREVRNVYYQEYLKTEAAPGTILDRPKARTHVMPV